MSTEAGLVTWGVVGAAVWGTFLVQLSVDIHRGRAGDDYSGYAVGGMMAGLLWPVLAIAGALWGVAYLIHLGIGRFVPRSTPVVPVDPVLQAAQREVETIAPSDA